MPSVAAAFLLALALFLSARPAPASPSPEAVDRGKLRLAWDGREGGDCDEALGYLEEVRAGSAVAGEAAWLQAECLLDLGRYEEAVAFLEGSRGRVAEGREELLLKAYWEWVWEATGQEDYAQALGILGRAQRALPDDGALPALVEATRFRQALAAALRGSDAQDLSTGETVSLRLEGQPPKGTAWVRAYPWRAELPWVPQATAREWMPTLAERLENEGRVLWVRVPGSPLRRRVAEEAARRSLRVSDRQGELRLSEGGEGVSFSADEWAYRAASEGLGISGAAASVVFLAAERLRDRRELFRWVDENRRELSAEPRDGTLRLQHPRTGRAFVFDPQGWAGVFRAPSGEWGEFWADIRAELGRPVRPYRCFCGREVVLREVLLAEPGEAVVLDRSRGFSAVGVALCRLHQQYVTPELARSWGVGPADLAARIREDAHRYPWRVSFSRGEVAGSAYLLLEGEGVAALGRSPDLLLGALEGVEGVVMRGRTVRVLAPTPTTLVIAEGSVPDAATDAAAARVLLGRAPSEGRPERLDFRARVRLPERGRGVFHLSAVD